MREKTLSIASGVSVALPLAGIEEHPKFNARQVYRDIDGLAASIEESGLEQPLVVYQVDGDRRFFLQSGFRRKRALEKLQQNTKRPFEVPCSLKRYKNHDEAMLSALAVDVTGDPLRSYDIAIRCAYLFDRFKGRQVARIVGLAPETVSRMLSCLRQLDPKVLEFWSKCPSPEMEPPLHRLYAWRNHPPMIQRRMLDAFRDGDRPITSENGDPALDKSGKRLDGKKPSQREIKLHALRIREKLDEPQTDLERARLDGMLRALRYVTGDLVRLT
jgi:hypothetical protein